jgi:hypothetical protein
MTLQASASAGDPLQFSEIQTEFNAQGSASNFRAYLKGAGIVDANDVAPSVPTSGTMNMLQFLSAQAVTISENILIDTTQDVYSSSYDFSSLGPQSTAFLYMVAKEESGNTNLYFGGQVGSGDDPFFSYYNASSTEIILSGVPITATPVNGGAVVYQISGLTGAYVKYAAGSTIGTQLGTVSINSGSAIHTADLITTYNRISTGTNNERWFNLYATTSGGNLVSKYQYFTFYISTDGITNSYSITLKLKITAESDATA